MDNRKVETSQEDYCRGCILRPGCNVVLKEGESCGDKASDDMDDCQEDCSHRNGNGVFCEFCPVNNLV